MSSNKIPLVIGVSGHRDPLETEAIRAAVRAQIESIKRQCPHTELVMLSSLAAGGDQICAETALEMGLTLYAPLPRAHESYREDFAGADLARFDALLKRAEKAFAVADLPSKEAGYREAGLYVARHSHVLLALWDGHPGTPDGCGTAEAVGFMLGDAFRRPDGVVIHVHTPRASRQSEGIAGEVTLMEEQEGAFQRLLYETDRFNAGAEEYSGAGEKLIDARILDALPSETARLHSVYESANALSLRNRDQYLKCMRAMAWFSVGLVLAFLLYDEMEGNLFLFAYAILGLFAWWTLRRSKYRGYHEKYITYRALAEDLRVQFYMLLSGLKDQAADYLTWSQKCEEGWISAAMRALMIDARPFQADAEKVQQAWIDSQLKYHESKRVPTWKKIRVNDRVANWTMKTAIAAFIVIVVLEFFFKGVITLPILKEGLPGLFLPHPGQEIMLRGFIKVLLGVSSAVSLFAAKYYGKLSLKQKRGDHEKMALLLRTAKMRLEENGADKEQILRELAREELTENGVWLSYCKDNAPDISL